MWCAVYVLVWCATWVRALCVGVGVVGESVEWCVRVVGVVWCLVHMPQGLHTVSWGLSFF